MKNILVLFALALFFIGCDEDPVKPIEETPFIPTGFTFTLNDSIHLYCNNGQLDNVKGDTIRLNWFKGEQSFKINYLDKDGNVLKDPDNLVYKAYAKTWKHSTKEDERAFASAFGYTLSLTPHDEGIAHFIFKLEKEGNPVVEQDSIPILIIK